MKWYFKVGLILLLSWGYWILTGDLGNAIFLIILITYFEFRKFKKQTLFGESLR